MKYTVIFVYAAVNIFLFFFNWNLFTTVLDVNFGFGTFAVLPFFILQIFSAFILAAYMLWDRMKDLKREVLITSLQKQIVEFQKNSEISALKAASKAQEQTLQIKKDLAPQS